MKSMWLCFAAGDPLVEITQRQLVEFDENGEPTTHIVLHDWDIDPMTSQPYATKTWEEPGIVFHCVPPGTYTNLHLIRTEAEDGTWLRKLNLNQRPITLSGHGDLCATIPPAIVAFLS